MYLITQKTKAPKLIRYTDKEDDKTFLGKVINLDTVNLCAHFVNDSNDRKSFIKEVNEANRDMEEFRIFLNTAKRVKYLKRTLTPTLWKILS